LTNPPKSLPFVADAETSTTGRYWDYKLENTPFLHPPVLPFGGYRRH
jgi:hypothetical protein